MDKNIYVIQGHPDPESFCGELANAYMRGGAGNGYEFRSVNLTDLDFQLSVSNPEAASLEPDLEKAREDIQWADHLVLAYPIWWGSMPALLKGFLDRLLIPGFAYSLRDESQLWEKLLVGRSARIIVTMDGPVWHNHLMFGKPAERSMRKSILEFCGIQPVHVTSVGPVDQMTDQQRANWLQKVEESGAEGT